MAAKGKAADAGQAQGQPVRAPLVGDPKGEAPEGPQSHAVPDLGSSAVPAAASPRARVSLSETGGLDWWRDPQTGLEVTRTPQEVPVALIGEACRRETAVQIQEL